MPDARLNRGERVGDRELGVVVGVDAPREVAVDRGADIAQYPHELGRQRAAVRVAQDERAGAGVPGGAERGQRVIGIRPVAVEEVLGVVDELSPVLDDEPDAVRDHVQVLGGRRAEHFRDVEQPALPEDRDDRGLGADELLQVRVVRGSV